MIFNLNNPIDKERFKRKANELYQKGGMVELVAKDVRTRSQNNYLHLIISYLAIETGATADYVKRTIFKAVCNPETFVRTRYDPLLQKEVKYLRSSAEVTKEEMVTAIDRFKNFCAEQGYRLPDANETEFLNEIEVEASHLQQYL